MVKKLVVQLTEIIEILYLDAFKSVKFKNKIGIISFYEHQKVGVNR